jgi:hypothetical protein
MADIEMKSAHQGQGIALKDRPPDRQRRAIVAGLFAGALTLPFSAPLPATEKSAIEVWTGPYCGCCKDWIRYIEANGFDVTSHEEGNSEARSRLGMPVRFGSCHTAEIDGYAIEGHVPVQEIRRLLAERPDAIGIAVPAMPRGSPGMDGPAYGNIQDPYDVLLIAEDGSPSVFQSYR